MGARGAAGAASEQARRRVKGEQGDGHARSADGAASGLWGGGGPGSSPGCVGTGQRARRGGRGRGGVRVAGDECGGATGSRARRRATGHR